MAILGFWINFDRVVLIFFAILFFSDNFAGLKDKGNKIDKITNL